MNRNCREIEKFEDLNFKQQASRINAHVSTLGKAIKAHLKKSNKPEETLRKCTSQIARMTVRLLK